MTAHDGLGSVRADRRKDDEERAQRLDESIARQQARVDAEMCEQVSHLRTLLDRTKP